MGGSPQQLASNAYQTGKAEFQEHGGALLENVKHLVKGEFGQIKNPNMPELTRMPQNASEAEKEAYIKSQMEFAMNFMPMGIATVASRAANPFGKFKRIDTGNPVEKKFISKFADAIDQKISETKGLSYGTLDKIGSLDTALKQKGFKGVNSSDFGGAYSLDNIIDNPKLFNKYPQLKEKNAYFVNFHTPTQRGVAIGDDIFLNSKLYEKDPELIESTLVHEIEHIKQNLKNDLPKFSQFEQGRGMTKTEYLSDLREQGARKRQNEYLSYFGR